MLYFHEKWEYLIITIRKKNKTEDINMFFIKEQKNNKPIKAFTLAETLITLVVVGIVAAITVPMISMQHQKEETITRIKKVYSVLQQTTFRAIADYGQPTTWTTLSTDNWNASKDFAERYLLPYMSVSYKCEDNTEPKCNYEIHNLNNTDFEMPSNTYRFYLQDGTFIFLHTKHESSTELSGRIFFDINGPKKPNKFGRDVFKIEYWIQSSHESRKVQLGKITPAWSNLDRATIMGTGESEYCHKSKKGHSCLGVIVKDGWKISDDYPW